MFHAMCCFGYHCIGDYPTAAEALQACSEHNCQNMGGVQEYATFVMDGRNRIIGDPEDGAHEPTGWEASQAALCAGTGEQPK